MTSSKQVFRSAFRLVQTLLTPRVMPSSPHKGKSCGERHFAELCKGSVHRLLNFQPCRKVDSSSSPWSYITVNLPAPPRRYLRTRRDSPSSLRFQLIQRQPSEMVGHFTQSDMFGVLQTLFVLQAR